MTTKQVIRVPMITTTVQLPPITERWIAHYAYHSRNLERLVWRITNAYESPEAAMAAAERDAEHVPGSPWVYEIPERDDLAFRRVHPPSCTQRMKRGGLPYCDCGLIQHNAAIDAALAKVGETP